MRASKFALFICAWMAAPSLAGCSSVKLMYTFADTLVERQVNRYLDLNRDQKRLVDRNIDLYFAWHRQQMLPRYSQFLREIAAAHRDKPASPEVIAHHWKKGRALWEATVRGAVPLMAPVMASLSPQQVRTMQERLRERGEEIKAQISAPREEVLKQRTGKMVEGFERFIGKLTPEQMAMVSARSEELFDDPWRWFKNRQRREYALIGFMMNRPSTEDAARFLDGWLLDPHQYSEPDYKAYTEGWQGKFQVLLHDVFATLTPAQRRRFVDTLHGYAGDFADLSS